jgi:hypothetical protein
MNSLKKETNDNFNNGCAFLTDNNDAVRRESVVIDLTRNKCQLLISNRTFSEN